MIYRRNTLRNRLEPLTASDIEHELAQFVPFDDSCSRREERKREREGRRKHENEEMHLFRRIRLKSPIYENGSVVLDFRNRKWDV